MGQLTILSIAVGLAMDAFAVSIAAGLRLGCVTGRQIFRLAFHFGFFQFM
ncbi:MAG TPA: manganese efflux pump, partial [Anaerolineae bacterium]|nr:manganese efflux pump [Anaerolineae bacterium]